MPGSPPKARPSARRSRTSLSAKLAAAEAEIAATKTQAMANVEAIAREAAAAIIEHITGWGADAEEIAKAVAAARFG